MNFSDKFVDFMTETIYGINANKHDKQNIKKKFGPIIEGKNSLFIKDPIQAQDFLAGYYHMWQELEQSSEEKSIIKTKLKKQKEQPIPDIWMEQYNDLQKHNQFLKDMLADKKKEEIEDYNTHPYCQKLLKQKDDAQRSLEEKKTEYNIKLQNLEEKKRDMLDQELELHKEKEQLEETFESQKKAFIRKAKAENKDEEKMEMKMLKEQVKKLKKKVEKRDKKIVVIQKENAKLQKQNLKCLTDSDNSDSDSDSDSD